MVVGNSTMRDIFFDLDVAPIGERPYKSTTELELRAGLRESTELRRLAQEVGLKVHPKARVWGAPLIASHVGADIAADLVATGFGTRAGIEMLVDVGTNTEVVVAGNGRILAASCPAGPAFEGGEVTYGMQASDGAIEAVRLGEDGGFQLETIGDAPPLGFCGSGLIDLIAELRRAGRMSPEGVFADRTRRARCRARARDQLLARGRLGARPGQGGEQRRAVDPAARARRRPGRRRPFVSRRRVRDLRQRRERDRDRIPRPRARRTGGQGRQRSAHRRSPAAALGRPPASGLESSRRDDRARRARDDAPTSSTSSSTAASSSRSPLSMASGDDRVAV